MEFDDSVQKQTKTSVTSTKKRPEWSVHGLYSLQQELLLDKFNLTVSFQFSADGKQMLLLS